MPVPPLPPLTEQAERLIALGVPAPAGLPPADLRRAVAGGPPGSLLAVHPDLVPASALAPLVRHRDKPGFVVVDMADVDDFRPVDAATVPRAPVYLVDDPARGDEYANRSPDEALPALLAARRTPLLLSEGLHWLLQQPQALERNHCFMTIGSRRQKADGRLDARIPAIWISNGTGRDGAGQRHAPKVGWCWAGNRHTWLGFASAAARTTPDPAGADAAGAAAAGAAAAGALSRR